VPARYRGTTRDEIITPAASTARPAPAPPDSTPERHTLGSIRINEDAGHLQESLP